MTEAQLTLKIKKKLQAVGCYCEKIHGGRYQSGMPDLIGCYDGHFFGFEVKLPGKERRVTKLQQHHIDLIDDAGGTAFVITGYKQAFQLLGIEE